MGDAVDVGEGVSASVLEDELEASDGADTGDGWGFGGEGKMPPGTPKSLGREASPTTVVGGVAVTLGFVRSFDRFERGRR